MTKFKYLIVGGGIAGTTAADTIRKEDVAGSIAIISDEPYELYSRIMLSKPSWFLEKVPFDQVWLKNKKWYEEKKVDFIGGKKAISIDSEKKVVKLEDGNEFGYEKLLLSIGACARKWDVSGVDKRGVFYLRTLDDAKGILQEKKSVKKAVIIGGGFISFEISDLLKQAGIEVTIVLREKYFWEPVLDEESGKAIERAIEKHGVKIIRNAEVQEIVGEGSVKGVVLKDGTKISCELLVVGIGVVCPLNWLKDFGFETNRGIIANEYLETSVRDVWTAGDVSEFNDVILGEKVQFGSWMNATEQGRVAGLNMVGKKQIFKKVTFYSTSGFDINICFVGDIRRADNRNVILRADAANNSYAQLFSLNGKLVGATLVNRAKEMQPIMKLIEKGLVVKDASAKLADAKFDLSYL